jgi:hypothetical protein
MAENAAQPGDPLFPTNRGSTMSHDALAQRLARHTATATLACPSLAGKDITPHVLRHTAAMQLLHAGVDITVIALWLGHESVTTAQIYLQADLALKQQALDRTTPPTITPGRFRPPDHLLAPSASELMHQDPVVKPNHQAGKLITVLEVEVHGRADAEAGPHRRAGS